MCGIINMFTQPKTYGFLLFIHLFAYIDHYDAVDLSNAIIYVYTIKMDYGDYFFRHSIE